jgi:hypothetical protein
LSVLIWVFCLPSLSLRVAFDVPEASLVKRNTFM